MTIIDSYTHLLSSEYLRKVSNISTTQEMASMVAFERRLIKLFPHAADIRARIEVMDKFKIDYQVVMPEPAIDPSTILPQGRSKQIIGLGRLVNDYMSDAAEKSSRRMFPIGVAPILKEADKGDATDEMTRCVKDLGIKGFMVPSNVNNKPIDEFAYLWEAAVKLDVPIVIHPVNTTGRKERVYERQYDLMHVFGWPFETTLILSRLVLSGMMEKYPTLKVLAHHLGGMVPFYEGRITESYRTERSYRPYLVERLTKDVFEYFRMFYYDTAVGGSRNALECGYRAFGSDHILFATDFPYGPDGGRKRLESYPDLIRSMGLSESEEESIFEKNAKELLKV